MPPTLSVTGFTPVPEALIVISEQAVSVRHRVKAICVWSADELGRKSHVVSLSRMVARAAPGLSVPTLEWHCFTVGQPSALSVRTSRVPVGSPAAAGGAVRFFED